MSITPGTVDELMVILKHRDGKMMQDERKMFMPGNLNIKISALGIPSLLTLVKSKEN